MKNFNKAVKKVSIKFEMDTVYSLEQLYKLLFSSISLDCIVKLGYNKLWTPENNEQIP